MIVQTRTEDLLKKVDNNYELVIAVSKRARQIADEHRMHSEHNIKQESEVSESALELVNDEYYVVK